MSYESIVRAKLSDLIPEEQMEVLKKNKAIIAGGCFTSFFSGKEVNDVDVYFKSKEDLVNCVREFATKYLAWFLFITDKSLTMNLAMQGVQTKVQFVGYDFFNDADHVFKHFDFTACMAGYDTEHDEIIMHDDFLLAVAQRRLTFDGQTRFPLSTLNRVDKYSRRGYSITGHQLMKIGVACSQIILNSWNDVNEHVGGVYGMRLREDLPEFSLETLMNNSASLFVQIGDGLDEEMFKKQFGIDSHGNEEF